MNIVVIGAGGVGSSIAAIAQRRRSQGKPSPWPAPAVAILRPLLSIDIFESFLRNSEGMYTQDGPNNKVSKAFKGKALCMDRF